MDLVIDHGEKRIVMIKLSFDTEDFMAGRKNLRFVLRTPDGEISEGPATFGIYFCGFGI